MSYQQSFSFLVSSSSSSTNGFSFTNFGFTSTTTTQSKGTTSTNNFNSNQQPSQTINKPLIGDLPKSTITTVFNNTTPAQPTPIKSIAARTTQNRRGVFSKISGPKLSGRSIN